LHFFFLFFQYFLSHIIDFYTFFYVLKSFFEKQLKKLPKKQSRQKKIFFLQPAL